MKISALASLLGVAATTLLPGVSASESEVSVVLISPLCRTLVLLYVRLCVAVLLTCSMTIIDTMMPAEGVYAILGRWKTAASSCVEALLSLLSSIP